MLVVAEPNQRIPLLSILNDMDYKEDVGSNRIHDQCARSYGYDVSSSLAARLKLELARRHISPEMDVLDVGCANGLFMLPLSKSCASITGIDINDTMLELAKAKLEEFKLCNARVLRQSAMELGFPDSSFDAAYCYSLLPLVPDPKQVISEIMRVLRPGGIALLDVPGRHNLSRFFFTWLYRRQGHPGVKSFSFRDILSTLEEFELDVLERHALGFTDQWKYVPGLHWFKFLDGVFHKPVPRDLDYRISNSRRLAPLANRWYFACRKRA